MANRLQGQSSPYLLQHAQHPVDWYPWGDEAFERAEKEDKPIFLSIGYSTCHWCHVMAEESFCDREIAQILNRYYISIKVDREERPDIDSVYMTVCQALTGSGGWPMSIFMTAQQKPFFAGTYFPKESRYGRVGFRELLLHIAERWGDHKEELVESSESILAQIVPSEQPGERRICPTLPEAAADSLSADFDSMYGGFGSAPKFPMPHNLLFLTLYSQIYDDQEALRQVQVTLEQMRRGGIFDQIGFGFSRYSTDRYFLIPHFEKMLYDNALLIIAYCAVYQVSRNERNGGSGADLYLDTAVKTAEYVLREMTGPEGEFYSAQDADSDGEEGRYYVWTREEVCRILGEGRGSLFCDHFGITSSGNFEGKSIPNLLQGNPISDDYEGEREILYRHRRSRAKLALDDKVLTSWNALMICAMSILYRAAGDPKYLYAAERAAQFMEKNLCEGDILYVSRRRGASGRAGSFAEETTQGGRSVRGFLDEYAYTAAAFLSLYDVTDRREYLARAEQFCRQAVQQFADEKGGFFLYGKENGSLIMRPKETYDGALPSGNSVMAYCLVRLSQLTGGEQYREKAEGQLAFLSAYAENYPAGYSMFLFSQILYFHPYPKITVVLSEKDTAEDIFPSLPLGANVKIQTDETAGYTRMDGKTTYYVCQDGMCLPPATEAVWHVCMPKGK